MSAGAGQAAYPCDLHCHSTLSDGRDTPAELVVSAVQSGLRVLALTDHDLLPPQQVVLPGGAQVELQAFAQSKGLCLLPGVEFSCETGLEDVHIVGLGCDWNSPALGNITQAIRRYKAEAYTETLRRLAERGCPIPMEELLARSGRQDPADLQKKHIFDLMAEKGYAPSWKDAKLMVRDDPFLSVERQKPAAQEVIARLHEAGGAAILAHPFLIDEQLVWQGQALSRRAYIERLIAAGLDGIEFRYPYAKTTCKDKRPPAELEGEVRALAAGRLVLSAGSDYHAEHKAGAADPRRLGECGLTQEEFHAAPLFQALYEKAMSA